MVRWGFVDEHQSGGQREQILQARQRRDDNKKMECIRLLFNLIQTPTRTP